MKKYNFFDWLCTGELTRSELLEKLEFFVDVKDPEKLFELYGEFQRYVNSFGFKYYELDDKSNIEMMSDSVYSNISFLNEQVISLLPKDFKVTTYAEQILNKDIFKKFEEIRKGLYTDLELFDTIKDYTGFDLERMRSFKKDLEQYVSIKQYQLFEQISEEDILEAINLYEERGMEIPLILQIFDSQTMTWRDRVGDEVVDMNSKDFEKKNYIDIEAVFYQGAFFHIYSYSELLDRKISDAEIKPQFKEIFEESKQKTDGRSKHLKPIIWRKDKQALKLFLEELKKSGLIKINNTDEIIKHHFSQSDKAYDLIQWCSTNRLLIYMFNKLTEVGLVDDMDRKFKLITEHFLDNKGQSLNRDSMKQDSTNMKFNSDPRGSKTIDSIIQTITLL